MDGWSNADLCDWFAQVRFCSGCGATAAAGREAQAPPPPPLAAALQRSWAAAGDSLAPPPTPCRWSRGAGSCEHSDVCMGRSPVGTLPRRPPTNTLTPTPRLPPTPQPPPFLALPQPPPSARQLDLGAYVPVLRSSGMTGGRMARITDVDLEREVGIRDMRHRVNVLRAIKKLQTSAADAPLPPVCFLEGGIVMSVA